MTTTIIQKIAGLDKAGKKAVRFGSVIIFLWIGGLKFFNYEAESIVPFVANSPFMSFFYNHPHEYQQHESADPAAAQANHDWHVANNTYGFSFGLGIMIVGIGLLVAIYDFAPLLSMFGSILMFVMTIGTLSFLISTPETWMPFQNGSQHGFPYLSIPGLLVIKDLAIMGGAILTMSESAALYLQRNRLKNMSTRDVN